MKYCTRGIQRAPEVKASINAQSVHTFTLRLRTTIHDSGAFTCTGRYINCYIFYRLGRDVQEKHLFISIFILVNLWDARHGLLDSANITFETTSACVCLQDCSCTVSITSFLRPFYVVFDCLA